MGSVPLFLSGENATKKEVHVMRKVFVGFCVLVLMTASVMAQGYVLQIGETAAPVDAGRPGGTVGFNVGDDTTYVGARGLWGPNDSLTLFAEAGLITVDQDGTDVDGKSIAIGGTLALPLGLPVDLAVRGVLIKPFFDDVDTEYGKIELSIYSVLVQGVASMPIEAVPGLSAYAAGGLAYTSTEVEWSGSSEDDTETELALAIGANMVLGDTVNLFVELSHIDDAFFGGGASILF